MAEPKKGYLPGIYRLVSGTVDANGYFSITNIPKEGYVPGIYKLTEATVDGDGNLSADAGDVGVKASITVTVDANGNLSETDIPQQGYVSGVYRVTTSTNDPKEGVFSFFTSVVGSISSGVWTATAPVADSLLQGNGDFLLQGNGDKILLG